VARVPVADAAVIVTAVAAEIAADADRHTRKHVHRKKTDGGNSVRLFSIANGI
jgi:hypothetical protein